MPIATIDDLRAASRVLCYGVSGAGKSTAAVLLGDLLDLPVHLVDDEIGWLPEWTLRPATEQCRMVDDLVAGDRWILDSAYSTWLPAVLARAQVVVALDYPRWLSLARLLRRTWLRILDRQPVCNGNVETMGQVFGRDSIIAWHFTSFARKRATIAAMAAAATGPGVLSLPHPRDLDALLARL